RGADLAPVEVQDRLLVRRVVVAGHQSHGLAPCPLTDRGDHRLNLLSPARPGDDAEHQLVLGIEGRVVPPVPVLVVRRVSGVTVLLLLVHERPFLIDGIAGKETLGKLDDLFTQPPAENLGLPQIPHYELTLPQLGQTLPWSPVWK